MILFLLLFIFGYWFLIKNNGEKAINQYNIIVAVFIFLVSGLRNAAIFGDTYGYVMGFIDLEDMTLPNIVFVHPRDSFFYIASHFLHPILFHNYTLWLLLISAVYLYPMFKLVKEFSVNPMWSWICFIFLGLFLFGMAGLRQVVAMGLCLNAFFYLIKGEWKKYFVFIAIAYLFHGTCMIFLLTFPFVRFRFSFNFTKIFIYVIAIAVILLFGTSILTDLTTALGRSDERYISYGEDMRGATFTYLYQQLLLVVPSLFFLRNRFKESTVALFSHISMIALIFISLSPLIAEMFRVSMYFSWANMVLFPMGMKEAAKKSIIFPIVFFIIFILYLVFINRFALTDYYFWFQDTSSITRFY